MQKLHLSLVFFSLLYVLLLLFGEFRVRQCQDERENIESQFSTLRQLYSTEKENWAGILDMLAEYRDEPIDLRQQDQIDLFQNLFKEISDIENENKLVRSINHKLEASINGNIKTAQLQLLLNV